MTSGPHFIACTQFVGICSLVEALLKILVVFFDLTSGVECVLCIGMFAQMRYVVVVCVRPSVTGTFAPRMKFMCFCVYNNALSEFEIKLCHGVLEGFDYLISDQYSSEGNLLTVDRFIA